MEQISGANLLAMRSLAQQAEDSAITTRGNIEALVVQHYVALQTENVKLRAQCQYMTEGLRDVFPQAHRLALELECLLSCNDNAAVSKWWDSANEALEQWREFCREDSTHNAEISGAGTASAGLPG